MRENGISVSIQIPDSSDAGQIKKQIEKNTQGNSTVKFNNGVMDIEMYPIKNLSVGGKNIYGPIDLQEILEKLLDKFLTTKRPIVIEPPSAAVGISVSINVLGGFVESGEIEKIIKGAVKSNLTIEKSGFRMNVHIYPLARASIQGVNIYGPTDLLKSLNTLLDKYLVKPDPTKGRNLNPEPRNLKGEPRILTKYEPTEKIEESTEESTEESKKE